MDRPDRNARPLVLLAAGGTGGHLFPAEALATALQGRDLIIDLVTDERVGRYGSAFPARATHLIPSDTLRGRNPIALARTGWRLGYGTGQAARLVHALRPAAVVGFGGYPTIPPLIAARLLRVPTLIHEQNAVMGRANRLVAHWVVAVATGFPGILSRHPRLAARATHTGNPVRPAVIEAAGVPYSPPDPGGPLRLLVFGGSQGARVMSEVVPPAMEQIGGSLRARLQVVQQAREEDLVGVRAAYARLGIAAEVGPFFPDLPARMARAHLVVSRSGASTVAELAAIGRPAILVPLPGALDQDQLANATALASAGGALALPQAAFTPSRLAHEIEALAAAPGRMSQMAQAARASGRLDAAERLADLVVRVTGGV